MEDLTFDTPKKNSIGCVVIAVLLLCVVGGIAVGTGIAALSVIFSPLSELEISIETPDILYQDTTFDLLVRVHNPSDRSITLSQIDIQHGGQIAIQGITPTERDRLSEKESDTFYFELSLPPQQTASITIHARALKSGTYQGTITLWESTHSKDGTFTLAIRSVDELISNLYRTVVLIAAFTEVDGEEQIAWHGSGTIISPDGLILTNAHVVLPDSETEIKDLGIFLTTNPDTPPTLHYYAEVLQANIKLDLAVLRISSDSQHQPIDPAILHMPYAPLGNSDLLQLGEPILILGYPGIGGNTITLTKGEVSGFTAEEGIGARAFIKTSATIAGGNSGGLAANSRGELIGVPTLLGAGRESDIVDCRYLADTNGDGVINAEDACIPVGGFINALRPINLAIPLIKAAQRGERSVPPPPPTLQPTPPGTIVFQDDFSRETGKWSTKKDNIAARYIKNGALWIEVFQEEYIAWSTYQEEEFESVTIQVSAEFEKAEGEASVGVICRYVDAENFHAFEISNDGYYTFWKFVSDEFITIKDWTPLDHFDSTHPLQITVSCKGQDFQLFLNNRLEANLTDPDENIPLKGKIGLLAGIGKQSKVTARFDNVIIWQP